MKFIRILSIFLFSILFLQTANALDLSKHTTKLSITFANPIPQKVSISIKNSESVTHVGCDISKISNIVNQHKKHICTFGFNNTPVTIIKINYQQVGKSPSLICPELTGKSFSHGYLIITPTSTHPTCNGSFI